ncbi:MAG: hypothetical protein QM820_20080 [Minicystis sp.]
MRSPLRWLVLAAAGLVAPALALSCGARNQLEIGDALGGSGGSGGLAPDATPDVVVIDAPVDVVVIDAPVDVVVVDAPVDVVVIDAPPDVVMVDLHGCADGTREAFLDFVKYPDIAGCAGGFSVPGINPNQGPACGRQGGDDGPNPFGQGCRAVDLCAAGFHVCESAAAVAGRSPDGCAGAHDALPGSFFVTGQSGPGCGVCATGTKPGCNGSSCEVGCAPNGQTTNDVFGCGNTGDAPGAGCGVLDAFGNDQCGDLPPAWSCPGDVTELLTVTKKGPAGGGVLCCRD